MSYLENSFPNKNSAPDQYEVNISLQEYPKPPFPPNIIPEQLITNALAKLEKTGKVSQIPNAFLIYRLVLKNEMVKKNIFLGMRELSGIASKLWNEEPENVKTYYQELSNEAKTLFQNFWQSTYSQVQMMADSQTLSKEFVWKNDPYQQEAINFNLGHDEVESLTKINSQSELGQTSTSSEFPNLLKNIPHVENHPGFSLFTGLSPKAENVSIPDQESKNLEFFQDVPNLILQSDTFGEELNLHHRTMLLEQLVLSTLSGKKDPFLVDFSANSIVDRVANLENLIAQLIWNGLE
ncbi:hypothetical protein G9A89_015911 [Geosiphon pyriformis]|nr:hypothetical protein G9A89_015911 [Geosiphon pyriformis]